MSYSKSSFTVEIDRNSVLSSYVQSCTMERINLGNKVIRTLNVDMQATDESMEWISNQNPQAFHFVHYSIDGKFGEGGNFMVKRVKTESSKSESGDLIITVIFEG